MSNIDKHAVQTVADLKAGYTLGHADVAILNELARIALASLEAEPVAMRWRYLPDGIHGMGEWNYRDQGYIDTLNAYHLSRKKELLYTAPPAPVAVPDEATPENIEILASTFAPHGVTYQWDRDECNAAADSWNSCREAMLQDAEPVTTAYKLPEGWVAVPVEPTAEMLQSGISAHYERSQIQIHDRPAPGPMECAYVAMLAAAPQQEVKARLQ